MFRIIISMLVITSQSWAISEKEMTEVLAAIRVVESNNNPDAVGDGGDAIGIYQIHRSYWQDAVEYDPSIGGSYRDCFNPKYAERIVRAYMARYCNARRLGHEPTQEDLARMHNGGPNGHKKSATLKYWDKVKDHMQ